MFVERHHVQRSNFSFVSAITDAIRPNPSLPPLEISLAYDDKDSYAETEPDLGDG